MLLELVIAIAIILLVSKEMRRTDWIAIAEEGDYYPLLLSLYSHEEPSL